MGHFINAKTYWHLELIQSIGIVVFPSRTMGWLSFLHLNLWLVFTHVSKVSHS